MSHLSRRRSLPALLAVGAALALTGCTGATVPMEPAPDAAAPECAEVSVRFPDTVDGLELRITNAQATGAWGDPAGVLLRCGVPTPGPTTDRCVSLDGIDWVEDDSLAPTYKYTTYGRSPALEVVIDASPERGISGTNVLMDLGDAVARLPKVGGCVGADDVFDASVAPTAPATDAPGATSPETTPAP